MTVLLPTLMALHAVLGVTTIEGQVVDSNGEGIAHAQVFLEPGLGGGLADAVADSSGKFTLDDVNPGAAGIFAAAPGFGFEGQHLRIAVDDSLAPLRLVLHPAVTIEGRIVNHDGDGVAGALITRIGVKGNHKVGVPLSKLVQFGYAVPQSDETGRFRLENVPAGCTVDMKVGHGSYAQEGVADVPAGAENVKVTLYPGVLVEGNVVSRSTREPVAQVSVLFQNAQPPRDTALVRSSLQGRFSARLKPGVYLFKAVGTGLRSGGWERLTITGERPVKRLNVAVAGTGRIRGQVRDALTGDPVRDVRIALTTNGAPAAVTRTGPQGDFLFTAGAGENIIRLEAVDGYFPPETQDMKVTLREDAVVELPGMWLKPLPDYRVTIVDTDGKPVPGALVTLLRPAQIGWYVADKEGVVKLDVPVFPDSGVILARAEHPTAESGALFRIEQHQAGRSTAQLFPYATVSGTVVNARGRNVGGATVGAFFPGEAASEATLLWQTTTDENGAFVWNAVVPGVPQRCAARAGEGAGGESETFNLAPADSDVLEEITLVGAKESTSRLGFPLPWDHGPVLCGNLAPAPERAGRPVLLFYTGAAQAPAVAASVSTLPSAAAIDGLLVAVVSADGVPCDTPSPVPIVAGTSPSAATTILLDRSGGIALETTGMPPLSVLRHYGK